MTVLGVDPFEHFELPHPSGWAVFHISVARVGNLSRAVTFAITEA